MRRSTRVVAACAAVVALASLAAVAKKPGPEWPGTYVYYDDAGNVVGEATNVLCKPQAAWGEVTANYDYNLGCNITR
ncbi:DUF6289 family protein [Luteimonas soli]|uniref:DUF6289 family protein n=1 Tax=Luteimonas soli TaxID=1648966 RepID=A0ABV7XN53_9GAMM